MFDPKKFTAKTQSTIHAAIELAKEEQHQQWGPVHIAVVLLEEDQGMCALLGDTLRT